MTGFIEVDDGIEVPEAIAPTMFERNFSEYMSFEDTGLKREELPQPTLWRVLVLPKQPKKMSAGGIALPDQIQEAEQHLNYIGQVVALGPLAGKNEKFQNPEWVLPPDSYKVLYDAILNGDSPGEFERRRSETGRVDAPRYLWDVKVSDWVIYGRYSGQVITYKGVRLVTLNDDDITQKIPTPVGYRVYV